MEVCDYQVAGLLCIQLQGVYTVIMSEEIGRGIAHKPDLKYAMMSAGQDVLCKHLLHPCLTLMQPSIELYVNPGFCVTF